MSTPNKELIKAYLKNLLNSLDKEAAKKVKTTQKVQK